MTALEVVTLVLAVAVPGGATLVGWQMNRLAKTFTSHMEATAVVGGQPRDIAVKQLQFSQAERAKTNELHRQRIASQVAEPSQVFSD